MNNDSEHKWEPGTGGIRGEEISFLNNGAEIRGVLFETLANARSGIVLVPDVHGLSSLYEQLGAALAHAGMRTLVLDIYSREGAPQLSDMKAVHRWIDALPDRRILSDIAAAAGYLSATGSSSTGVVGFCLGGQFAIMSACRIPQFTAAVSFYGMLQTTQRTPHRPESALDMIRDLACPLLGLYGLEDALIPVSDLDELESSCSESHLALELHRYPGAGHAFLNLYRPEAFRPHAAEDAWGRTIEFLQKTLR